MDRVLTRLLPRLTHHSQPATVSVVGSNESIEAGPASASITAAADTRVVNNFFMKRECGRPEDGRKHSKTWPKRQNLSRSRSEAGGRNRSPYVSAR